MQIWTVTCHKMRHPVTVQAKYSTLFLQGGRSEKWGSPTSKMYSSKPHSGKLKQPNKCTDLVSLGWLEHRLAVLIIADVGIVLIPLQGDVAHCVPNLLQEGGSGGRMQR